jgi:ABC-type amino acid transport substrate-binding protein
MTPCFRDWQWKKQQLRYSPKKADRRTLRNSFQKIKEYKSIQRNLNKFLNDIHDDGTLNAIKEKWGVF